MKEEELTDKLDDMALAGLTNRSVIHELKNLLVLISLTNEQLTLAIKSENLQLVQQLSERIESLTNQSTLVIQNTNKIFNESLWSSETLVEHPIEEIVLKTIGIVEPQIQKFNIQIEHNISNKKLAINPTLLSQVFINLINNSIHEIKGSNNPWIKINEQQNEDQYTISVIDSGIIAKEEIPNLFKPMYTTKNETGEGSGLGLWISKKILQKHGGDLTCDLKEGHTSFNLIFK